MITNNKEQIGLLTESRGVVNPTLDLAVIPVSVLFSNKNLLINRQKNSNFSEIRIGEVNSMDSYKKDENPKQILRPLCSDR